MRINLREEPMLNLFYEVYKKYKAEGEPCIRGVYVDDNLYPEDIVQYGIGNGLFNDKPEIPSPSYNIALEGYKKHLQKVHGSVFRHGLNVEIVSQSFCDSALQNSKSIVASTQNEGYYELLGECSGLLVLPNHILEYGIAEDGSFFNCVARHHLQTDNKEDFGMRRYFGKATLNLDSSVKGTTASFQSFVTGVAVLVLKKYGEVETQIIASGARRKELNSEDYIFNNTPFRITQLDSSWLRTIVRTEGFMVRGHFRLQPFGEKRLQRKLIYIEPFEKHGYTRRAKKLIEEEKQS